MEWDKFGLCTQSCWTYKLLDDFLDDDSEGQSGVLTVDVLDEFRYRFSVGVRFERVTLLRLRKQQQQLDLHYRKSSTLKRGCHLQNKTQLC